jgi:SAM-dependent methyltransferase
MIEKRAPGLVGRSGEVLGLTWPVHSSLRWVLHVGDSDIPIRNQERHWSRHAAGYDDLFLDPFASGVKNPLWDAVAAIANPGRKTVADLGCGTGRLLPHLLERFSRVIALDFAPAMLACARERLGPEQSSRVCFLQRPMHELDDLAGQIDVAITINSLVMPDVRLIDRTLRSIHASLRPKGVLLGIVPSIDAIQYHTMLLLDQALEQGLDPADAMRFTGHHAEHRFYDFAFGRFKFQGLRQKFWLPFEVEHRLCKAGFRGIQLSKVLYPWDQSLAVSTELGGFPPSWDWFFLARRQAGQQRPRGWREDIASGPGSP